MFGHFIISILAAYGFANAIVEKWREWPIRRLHLILRHLLGELHPRLPRMLSCVACTSFWAALPADILLFVFTLGHYWTWPLSGFAAFGLSWTFTEIMNSIDRFLFRSQQPKDNE